MGQRSRTGIIDLLEREMGVLMKYRRHRITKCQLECQLPMGRNVMCKCKGGKDLTDVDCIDNYSHRLGTTHYWHMNRCMLINNTCTIDMIKAMNTSSLAIIQLILEYTALSTFNHTYTPSVGNSVTLLNIHIEPIACICTRLSLCIHMSSNFGPSVYTCL